jgi:Carboxypeptidase regulatory-like domain
MVKGPGTSPSALPRLVARVIGLIGVSVLGSCPLLAQGFAAAITGMVQDSSGAAVSGAMVTARHVDTGLTRAVEADASGNYTIPSLPVGAYELTAEKAGFRQEVRRGINLVVAQEAVVNFTLQVGSVTQQVTVTEAAPLINTTTTSTSGLISEQQIKELPLNGRSFDQLLTLNVSTANISSNRNPNQPGNLFSVAGRRPEENRFLMNGVDYVSASGGINTASPNGSNGQVLGVDAVREFNVVEHTYGAEYGKRAGGQISIVTTSGTNQLHGDIFEYLRNSGLDARNFFDYPQGLRIPPFKRNQFGGALGGPLKKDKLFLFGNYEGFRQRLGISSVSFVPDANARLGLLPPDNNPLGTPVPVAGLKPGMLPYANYFWPAPNGPELGGGLAKAFANPLQKVREDFGLLRADYHISAKDSFSASYLIQDGENDAPSPDPNFFRPLPLRSQLFSSQETHVFSNALLNVATLGFSRGRIHLGAFPAAAIPQSDTPSVTLPQAFVSGNPPGTIVIGGSSTGAGLGTITTADGAGGPPGTFARNFFTGADDLHYVKGSHSLSAGLWIQRVQSNRFSSSLSRAVVSYPTLRAFLTDAPTSFQAISLLTTLGFRSTEAAWYIQDELKLRPNLTLRLGLRDEMTNGYNEATGRCARYILDQNSIVQTNPLIGNSCLTENNAKALLQPRLGLAWDPTHTGSWAVRAGFGIYNTLQDNLDQAFGGNPPFNARFSNTTPLLSQIPLLDGTPAPPSCSPTQSQPCAIFTPGQVDPTLHTPTVQEWSLTVERELTRDLALQVGYVGSESYHLEVGLDANTIQPVVCQNPQGCLSGGVLPPSQQQTVPRGTTYVPPGKRPNPFLSRTFARDFPGTSSYHALNVALIKRLSYGLSFKTNYTFSKILDVNSQLDTDFNLSAPSDVLDSYDLALSKGPAAFSVEHQFNGNVSYELPFGRGKHWGGAASGVVGKLIDGWQWNSIVTAQTGLPFTPTVGSNRSGNGDIANPDVPNLNPASGPVILGTPNQWFNPNAFLLPTAGTFGNAGRNQFLGPNLIELDMSMFKKISINERWNLQFRAEAFNLLNRSNFGQPAIGVFAGTSVSPSAGVITSTATTSRQLQLALKLLF